MSRLEILRGLKDRDRNENFLTYAEFDLICSLIEELEEDNG